MAEVPFIISQNKMDISISPKELTMKIRTCLACFMAAAIAAVSTGCGGGAATSASALQYTYKDQTITVKQKPERVVTLTAPLLNMAYAVGGTAVGRPSTENPIPDAAKSLPELGRISNINMESLVGLKPDLVIGEKAQNQKLTSLLESNKIPYILINYDGIHDNVPLLTFLGQIYGTKDKTDKVIKGYEAGVKKAMDRGAGEPVKARIAVLRATGKSVTAETPEAITASMCEDLKMNNVITSHKEMNLTAKTVPYSLEQLSADDPDIIFVVTMGKAKDINKKMDEDMRSNPAWSNLKAVRENHVIFLPSDLYLLNPGIRTPEAMEGLLDKAYGKE